MGKLAYDDRELAFVQLASGPFPNAALEELLEMIDRAATASNERRKTLQWITIIDDAAEPPSAVARKRIIDSIKKFRGLDSATVVTSSFQRAVVTAFTWLRPTVPGQRFGVFATEADAVGWMAGFAGQRPVWARLLAEVRSPKIGEP